MKQNYANDAKQLVALLGKENILTATHCQTRLRLVLKDTKKVDTKAIEKIPSVKGTFTASGQFQVIIGTDVANFYKEFIEFAKIKTASKAEVKEIAQAQNQGNWFQKFIGLFSEIFVPIIPLIVAGGLILAFRNILEMDWNSNPDEVWTIVGSAQFWAYLNTFLWLPANAIFWYLPVYVVWSIFNKKGKSPALGIALGIMLVSPGILVNMYDVSGAIGSYYLGEDITATYLNTDGTLVTDTILVSGIYDFNTIVNATVTAGWIDVAQGDALKTLYETDANEAWDQLNTILVDNGVDGSYKITNIFGAINAMNAYYFWYWPLALSYIGQVIPALLVGLFAVWLYDFLDRHTHPTLSYIWPPLGTILITIVVAHGIIGPIGAGLSFGITYVFEWAFTNTIAKWFFAPLFGALYPLVVVTGLHHTLNATMISLTIADANYMFNMLAMSNIAQGAAVFAVVWLARKDQKMRQMGTSAGVTCWLGVTEPAMYGVNLKYVFPFVAAMIGSAIASTLIVALDLTAVYIGMGGILGIFNVDTSHDFLGYQLGGWLAWLWWAMIAVITVVVTILLTFFFSKKSHWFKKLATTEWEEYMKEVDSLHANKAHNELHESVSTSSAYVHSHSHAGVHPKVTHTSKGTTVEYKVKKTSKTNKSKSTKTKSSKSKSKS